MMRSEILEHAHRLVSEDRAESYGDAKPSHERIASMWSAMLGVKISAYDVALCMIALKLVRAQINPQHIDSLIDLAGYAALASELVPADPNTTLKASQQGKGIK